MARVLVLAALAASLLTGTAVADGVARSMPATPGQLGSGTVYSAPSYSGSVGTPQSYYSGQPSFSGSTGYSSGYATGPTTVTRSDGFVTQYAPGGVVQTPVVTSVPQGYRTDSCESGQIAYGQEYVVCSGRWIMTDTVVISDVAPQYPVRPVVQPAPVYPTAPAPVFYPAPQPAPQQFAMAPAALTGGVGLDIGTGFVGGGGGYVVTSGSSSVAARSPIPIIINPRGRMPHRPNPPPCGGGCGGGHPPPPPPPPCGGGCGHGH